MEEEDWQDRGVMVQSAGLLWVVGNGNEYKKGSGCCLAGELAQPPMGMGMTLQYRIIIKSCLLVVYCWWLAHPRD